MSCTENSTLKNLNVINLPSKLVPGEQVVLLLQCKKNDPEARVKVRIKGNDNRWCILYDSISDQEIAIKFQAPQSTHFLLSFSYRNEEDFEYKELQFETIESELIRYTYPWTKLIDTIPRMLGRDGGIGIVHKDTMWLFGGWNGLFQMPSFRDIFSSVDGIHWTYRGEAPWEGRHLANCVVFKDSIWLFNGDENLGHYQRDLWNSADGIHWNKVMEPTPWPARTMASATVFDNSIWMTCGEQLPIAANGTRIFNDVWRSKDGRKWEKMTTQAEFQERSGISGIPYFDQKLWIIGGGKYIGRKVRNDVWSSCDGIKWQLIQLHAPWKPRHFHNVETFNDRLWVINGYSIQASHMNDDWSSSDGMQWIQNSSSYQRPPRHAVTLFNYHQSLYLLGGQLYYTDCWKMTAKIVDAKIGRRSAQSGLKGYVDLYTGFNTNLNYYWFMDGQMVQKGSNHFETNKAGNYQVKLQFSEDTLNTFLSQPFKVNSTNLVQSNN